MKVSRNIFNLMAVLMLLMGVTLFFSISSNIHLKNDNQRLENSFAASKQLVKYYTTKNGELAAKVDVLQLKYNEVKDIYPEIISEIKNLKITPRSVNNYSETVIHQDKEIVATLHDSTIYDTLSVRVFNYHDRFYTVRGLAVGDTQKVHIESRDSLTQVVYKGERYKPWLWIFSKRKLQQVISCKNPDNKIEYSKFIQILK